MVASRLPVPRLSAIPDVLLRFLRSMFGIDPRSLAAFRIGLGLVLLGDLITRARFLVAHYTDSGVLPRTVLIEEFGQAWGFSLHALSGTAAFQAFLFIVAGLFATALFLGYHTRLATVASWFMLVSLHSRNPVLLQGGDTLLRLLLFWGMFLPLSARFSLDQRQGRGGAESGLVASVASAGLLLQVVFVYVFTAILKWGPAWYRDGTAVGYALSVDQFVTPIGRSLLQFPELLRVATFATVAFEALGPLLALVALQSRVRTAVAFAFFAFHAGLGLGLTLELGHFPFVCVVAWLPFLTRWYWERVGWVDRESRVQSRPQGTRTWISVPVQAMAAFFLAYIFVLNVESIDDRSYIPDPLGWVTPVAQVNQYWGMFSPEPPRNDGWYVVVGSSPGRSDINLLASGGPLEWDKPKRVSSTFGGERWRKYLMSLRTKKYKEHLPHYTRYLCRAWNRGQSGTMVSSVQVFFMLERTLPDFRTAPVRKVLLHRRDCGAVTRAFEA